MANFVCYDRRGAVNPSADYLLTKIYQWDTNRQVVIRGLPIGITGNLYVHFTNPKLADAYVVEPTVGNGDKYISAEIPNSLLMMPDNIIIYICEHKASGEQITLDKIIIPVVPRPMPSNYIYQLDLEDELVADGLIMTDNALRLASDGVPFGRAAYISN